MGQASRVRWTREHSLIALNLYCKLPFGQLYKGNAVIKEVASRMGRTASSLSMKLCNFAALDPVQRARGIRGLSGATKQDREMWAGFHERVEVLAPESEELLHNLFTADDASELDFLERGGVRVERAWERSIPSGPTEGTATVRVRRGQQFFRQAVLRSYGVRCCITGIPVPRLLVASHIKPWRDFPGERLNPRNGLCLSSLHDAAFDAGLITLDDGLKVVLSRRLRDYFPQSVLELNFVGYEGKEIRRPEKFAEPDPLFLEYHREVVFAR